MHFQDRPDQLAVSHGDVLIVSPKGSGGEVMATIGFNWNAMEKSWQIVVTPHPLSGGLPDSQTTTIDWS